MITFYAGTIPAKLLSQLSTAFEKGGLRNRSGTFFYKDHLHKSNVPLLALAGDEDLICPPEAVYGRISIRDLLSCLLTYLPFFDHFFKLTVKFVLPCYHFFKLASNFLLPC